MGLRFQQKLIIPSSARPLVQRKNLIAQLEQAISTKSVTALAAPAGWGKTTALAQWAAISSLPVAWYTLDATDRDPHLFLDYLLHSVAAFVPDVQSIVAQLASTGPSNLPDLMQATALAIAAAPEPFALVFDDFHVIAEHANNFGLTAQPQQPEMPLLPGTALILDLLAALGEYAANCHLVFASRTLPTLHGLVRMVAQQRAAVFDYNALQFQTAEVQQLAGSAYSLTLSDDSANMLISRLGGWVTGIVLSLDRARAEHHNGDPFNQFAFASQRDALADPTAQIDADTAQVYAFFAEQILAPLSSELCRFLEDTSVLEDLSPQRCDALRQRDDSALLLEEVKRHGLFVSSRAGWLAYHSLFRDFLRLRLARDPQRWRTLMRRAGDLSRSEKQIEHALDCYLAADATDEAFALLRESIPRLRRLSRQTTLLACFERLGHERLLPSDLLLAQARVYSDLALWERAYLALQLVETIGNEEESWEAHLLHADLLNLQGQTAQAQVVLNEVDSTRLPPNLQLIYHLTAGRIQIITGAIDDAIVSLEQALTLTTSQADTVEDPSGLADIYDNLGLAYAMRGDRPTALRHLKRADACWQLSGNSGRRALTLNNLGMLASEEGRYAEARSALEQGLEIAQQTARRREEIVLRCTMAELDTLEGALSQALTHFSEAYSLAVRMEVVSSIATAAAGAYWITALQGDHNAATAWQTQPADAPPEVQARLALAKAHLLVQRPHPPFTQIAAHVAKAREAIDSLSLPERACLALLEARIAYEESGWTHAAEAWEQFNKHAGPLTEQLLQILVRRHHVLLNAASASPLTQRLAKTQPKPDDLHWEIQALGAFSCTVNGEPCDLSPLHRTVLVRLLDAGPSGLLVERLWEEVWGETELSMPALHQALRRLRVQTGLAMAARDGHVAIRSPWEHITYDVRDFEQAIANPEDHESMQQAIALYRGDFLTSAPLSAAHWVDTRRMHLQQRYLNALEQLAQSVEQQAPHLAIQYYQQVLQIDGCRERTATQLMRLAARFGNRSLVYSTFEQLKGSLRMLGATPEPATAALYQQLH